MTNAEQLEQDRELLEYYLKRIAYDQVVSIDVKTVLSLLAAKERVTRAEILEILNKGWDKISDFRYSNSQGYLLTPSLAKTLYSELMSVVAEKLVNPKESPDLDITEKGDDDD